MTTARRFLCWVLTGHVYGEEHPVVVIHQDMSWGPHETHYATNLADSVRFCGFCGQFRSTGVWLVCS